MAAYERVTLNRGGRNSRFVCTLVNSGDLDEMLHYAAFHQGLHCLLR